MAARGRGTVLFVGATASLRRGADFPAFASAKFALRGLARSLARVYWPRGVHVAHVVCDGRIGSDDGLRAVHQDELPATLSTKRHIMLEPAWASV